MAGPAARDHEQRIDTHVVAIAHEARREALGGNSDTTQAPFVERESGSAFARPRLDLHEGEGAAAPRDNVNFAAAHSRTACKNAPTVEPQVPACDGLGSATALFGGFTV